MDPPTYPASDDPAADERPAPTTSWGARIGIAAVIVVIAVIVVLHLTGVVGPGPR